ncbi:MAG TPA: hypothetical protein VGH28_25060 [Polyangiaceae bacterium]|jgi:hypothetical protein
MKVPEARRPLRVPRDLRKRVDAIRETEERDGGREGLSHVRAVVLDVGQRGG